MKTMLHRGGPWWECLACHRYVRAECACCEPPRCCPPPASERAWQPGDRVGFRSARHNDGTIVTVGPVNVIVEYRTKPRGGASRLVRTRMTRARAASDLRLVEPVEARAARSLDRLARAIGERLGGAIERPADA